MCLMDAASGPTTSNTTPHATFLAPLKLLDQIAVCYTPVSTSPDHSLLPYLTAVTFHTSKYEYALQQ